MYTSSDQSLIEIHNDLNGYQYDANNQKIKDSSNEYIRVPIVDTLNGYFNPNISTDTNKAPNMTAKTNNQYDISDLMYELIRQLSYLNTKFDALVQIANNIQTLTNTVSSMNSTLSSVDSNLNALAYSQSGLRTSDVITNISEDTDNLSNLSNIYNKLDAITASGESGEFLKCGTNY